MGTSGRGVETFSSAIDFFQLVLSDWTLYNSSEGGHVPSMSGRVISGSSDRRGPIRKALSRSEKGKRESEQKSCPTKKTRGENPQERIPDGEKPTAWGTGILLDADDKPTRQTKNNPNIPKRVWRARNPTKAGQGVAEMMLI